MIKRVLATFLALTLSVGLTQTFVPMKAYAEGLGDLIEGELGEYQEEDDEYQYLDTNMRLSWGEKPAGSTLEYQNALITNNGTKSHTFNISVSSGDMWDILLPNTNIIAPGQTISVPIRPNLSSPKWGVGEYSDVLTIVGFDSDCCDITCTASVNLYITVTQKATPWVSNVTVSPASVTLSQGQSYSFNASVTSGDGADATVTWSLSGNTSTATTLTNGTLVVGANETANTLTVTATSNQDSNYKGSATVTINKSKCNIGIQTFPSNGGSVAGAGSYNNGDLVTLVANPANGFSFDGWYENNNKITSDLRYTFTAGSSRTVNAKFIQNSVRINTKKNIDQAGTITGSQTLMYGGNYTIIAKANAGYKFVGWYEGNNLVTNSETYTMNGITSKRELTAVFQQIEFKILLNVTPQNGGKVTGGGTYKVGTDVALNATPANGFNFAGWICNNQTISTSPSITINKIDKDYSITAIFAPKKIDEQTFTISASAGNGGIISPAGSIPAIGGKSMVFSISANKNYKISDVKVDGVSQGAISTYTFYSIDKNHSIVASFEAVSPAPDKSTTTPKDDKKNSGVTGAKDVSRDGTKEVTTEKPVDDQSTNVDEVSEVTSMNGVLQDMNITPDEARALIENGQDRSLMEAALVRGDLQVTVVNGFATTANETAIMSYYEISSVPNIAEVIDSLILEEDKLAMFQGTPIKTNLHIGGLAPEQVYGDDKQIIEQNCANDGIAIENFFDVRFITEIDGAPALVTTLNKPMRVVLNVPESMKLAGKTATCVLRVHDGVFDILEDLDDNPDTITFETDKMSTFAIGYYASENTQEVVLEETSQNTPDTNVAPAKDNTGIVVGVAIGVIVLGIISMVIIVASSDKKRKRRHHRKN